MLEAARREADARARNVRDLQEKRIAAAADDIAALWLRRDSPGDSPAEAFAAAATRLVAEESAKLWQHIEHVRAQLAETLHGAAQVLPSSKSALQELPKPTGLPLPDPSAVAQKLALRRPAVLSFFGKSALARHLRPKLREQVGLELHDCLGLHSQRLRDWVKETFAAVETAFFASAEIFLAQLERCPPAVSESAEGGERLRRDIMLLEKWAEPTVMPKPVSSP